MAKSRRPYPLEFRQRMIELVRSGRTPADLARTFEPSAQCISTWVKQAERDKHPPTERLTTEERIELQRLRRENITLREEREILKKAAAWFARETGSIPPGSSNS
jgi:transposase